MINLNSYKIEINIIQFNSCAKSVKADLLEISKKISKKIDLFY